MSKKNKVFSPTLDPIDLVLPSSDIGAVYVLPRFLQLPLSLKNRATEKDIRDWLDLHGFAGSSAKISDVELHAIKRPGWEQVFRFHARIELRLERSITNDDAELDSLSDCVWVERFGVVLDDERNRTQELRTQIWIFEDEPQQLAKLELVSQGMLVRNSETDWLPLLWIMITAIIFLLIVAVVSSVAPG